MSGGWDEDDSGAEEQGGELAALDFYELSPTDGGEPSDASDAAPPAPDEGDDSDVPAFTVTNPAGTVSVTAYLTGPIKRVDLDAGVVRMTEHELAEEIRVLAELAQLKARSVMHAFLLEGLARMGHDRAEWSSILSAAIQLPSPEQAAENIAEVFAVRYRDDQP